MRIKASESLKRLKKMKTKKRKSTTFKVEHEINWYGCDAPIHLAEYIKLISWCNKNVSKRYSRAKGTFWFEDEKDAFKFRLRWGKSDDK